MTSKVYHGFQFFNELDVLELKLETMDSIVDYFVISESTKTHQGKEKTLYYNENKNRYKKFHHKIIHQIIDDTPSHPDELNSMKVKSELHARVIEKVNSSYWYDKYNEPYLRDTYEKEALLIPLTKCNFYDIIILSDLDEILRPESFVFEDNQNIYHFQHDMFYYYLNLQKDEPWHGCLAMTFKDLLSKSYCEERNFKKGVFVDQAGWHFTYQGNADQIRTKIESYSHQDTNMELIKNNLGDNIENCMTYSRDLLYRPCNFTVRDVNDGTFPKHLVENQDGIYKNYIKRSNK